MITAFWDIDGTLVRSPGTRADLFAVAIASFGVKPVPPKGSREGFTDRKLAELHLRTSGLDVARVDEFLNHLDELSEAFYAESPREPVPGAREALQLTRRAGWRNGLLTGNTPRRAKVKLSTSGFDLDAIDWTLFASGGFVTDRAELGRQARALAGEGPLVVLGDTLQDALAAEAAGATFVAVNTEPAMLQALAGSAVLAVDSLGSDEFRSFVDSHSG